MLEAPCNCNSCNKKLVNLKGSTIFKCPSCSEVNIVRCIDCRTIAAKYTCSKCKFTGPN
ncbi:MAG: zinc finger domain-containing protein [Candidatus Nanoarchaeia archaeon]|nr:zinc finger domain-containing protein [Candidatus Nanoarchaeia archaeon]